MTFEPPPSDQIDSSSTHAILAQLTSLELDANAQLGRSVIQLMMESDQIKITQLKDIILTLIIEKSANVFKPCEDKTVLQKLLSYYLEKNVKDPLFNLVVCMYRYQQFVNFCYRIFQLRKFHEIQLDTHFIFPHPQKPNNVHYLGYFILTCVSMDEAIFYATTLENFLYEHIGIPYRSSTKHFSIYFKHNSDNRNKTDVIFSYRPDDYLKWNFQSLSSVNPEDLVCPFFKNPGLDYYDYCDAKYPIKHNTRGFLQPTNTTDEPMDIESSVKTALSEPLPAEAHDFSAKLLIITRTGLGYGNFMNARLAIEGLCKKIPHLSIDWILANDGDTLPSISRSVPKQVALYETDALWKLFPLIRSLSMEADIVLYLPNNFLRLTEQELLGMPLILSPNPVMIEVSEYNYVHEKKAAYFKTLLLTSGINPPGPALGILKPSPLVFPKHLEEKRQRLCQDSTAAELFRNHPTAPLYFAYAYQPVKGMIKSDIVGMNLTDVLALFVQHAKSHLHTQIKLVLPIRKDTLQETFEAYPHVFTDCMIEYIDSNEMSTVLESPKPPGIALLHIQIFNLFPLSNIVFRSLLDYAAAWNTPLVTTGDQSFFELFFSISQGFIFLYQLLEHKKPLLEQIKVIMATEQLITSLHLITMTEHGLHSEHDLIALSDYLYSHESQLKQESLTLRSIIQSQPELTESLAKVIIDCVAKKRLVVDEKKQYHQSFS